MSNIHLPALWRKLTLSNFRVPVALSMLASGFLTVPAAPVQARTGKTCKNVSRSVPTAPGVPLAAGLITYARICISWNDAPSGSKYTTRRVRIWNPPVGTPMKTYAIVYHNDGSPGVYTGAINDGVTYIKKEKHIGSLTTKFEVASNKYSQKYCLYMAPTTYNLVPGGC